MAKIEIHSSDVKLFKQCRVKWHFQSPLRMNLEPDYPISYFWFGRGFHIALDAYYGEGEDPGFAFEVWWKRSFDKINAEAEAKYGFLRDDLMEMMYNHRTLGTGMMEHYVQTYPAANEPFEVLDTETTFNVTIATPSGRASPRFYAAGRFDGRVELDDGTQWLLEHKTAASFSQLSYYELDEQAKLYVTSAEAHYGTPIEGVFYNFCRKKVPTQPRVLQNGNLSQNKQIDTTVQAYVSSLREHELDPEDHMPILRHLHNKGNTFFLRKKIRHTPGEKRYFKHHLYEICREMCNPKVRIFPTPSYFECDRCAFREPCLMFQAQQDYRALLEVGYRTKVPRTEEIT